MVVQTKFSRIFFDGVLLSQKTHELLNVSVSDFLKSVRKSLSIELRFVIITNQSLIVKKGHSTKYKPEKMSVYMKYKCIQQWYSM